MTDVHTKEQRSYNMSRIRASKTKPEIKLKKTMGVLGFSYQPKKILGKPDFANKKQKIAVFVDGCFWHKCQEHFVAPKQNSKFWKEKINKNTEHDNKINKKLKKEGWKVLRIWEHDVKNIK